MPDDIFRIVITVAVVLACLAFVVQAGVAFALYRVMRALQKKMSPVADHIEKMSAEVAPVIAKITPLIDRAAPIMERVPPILDKVPPILAKVGPAVDAATRTIQTVQKTVEETRPRVAEISTEAVAIARSGRQQVERIGELLGDAGDKARERLDQIDRSVDSTVEHLEQAGDAMKRAVMRPVREVNGLAAGISAAVSSLVRGARRPSVDHATQDEEMFI